MERLGLLAWGFVAVVVFVSMALSVLKGGFIETVRLAVMLIPVVFILFINLRKHWHTMLMIALTVHTLTLNIFPFRNLGPAFLLAAAIGFVLLLDNLIHARDRKQHHDGLSMMAAYVALVYIARIIYDRPGVVALGMDTGGLTTALYSVMAALCYFVTRALFVEATLTRKQVWIIGLACLLLNAHQLNRSIQQGFFTWYQELADAPTWMSCAAVLACLAPALVHNVGMKFYMAMGGYFAMGLLSAHRSRILFIGLIVLMIGSFVGRAKRLLLVLAIVSVTLGIGLVAMGGGRLPSLVARALSLIVPEQYWMDYSFRSGPMGWEDTFRSEMYRYAWSQIRSSPIVGTGLGVNVEDAFRILTGSQDAMVLQMILWGRSFHNSFLIIAVEAGVPTALCVIVLCIVVFVRFVRFSWVLPQDDVRKTWAMMLCGFWIATMGMILINGGVYEFFNIMALNGAMAGMMIKSRVTAPAPQPVQLARPTLPPRIAPVAQDIRP